MSKNNGVRSILMVGVGGQGIIRASDILSTVLMKSGFDVKKSEVHGMAQRGGCVSSHVRYGKKVYSPLTRKGDVDVMLSFEKLETLRYLDYMRSNGVIIINEEEIYPPSVNLGEAPYPHEIEDIIRKYFNEIHFLNATKLALNEGDQRMANTIMLGALSPYLDIGLDTWEDVFRTDFPPKVAEKNYSVFKMVRNQFSENKNLINQ
jgi:indolepyruvate ferredoxin oxidoreductase, beta subunit